MKPHAYGPKCLSTELAWLQFLFPASALIGDELRDHRGSNRSAALWAKHSRPLALRDAIVVHVIFRVSVACSGEMPARGAASLSSPVGNRLYLGLYPTIAPLYRDSSLMRSRIDMPVALSQISILVKPNIGFDRM
jgi:hypothetical protein